MLHVVEPEPDVDINSAIYHIPISVSMEAGDHGFLPSHYLEGKASARLNQQEQVEVVWLLGQFLPFQIQKDLGGENPGPV